MAAIGVNLKGRLKGFYLFAAQPWPSSLQNSSSHQGPQDHQQQSSRSCEGHRPGAQRDASVRVKRRDGPGRSRAALWRYMQSLPGVKPGWGTGSNWTLTIPLFNTVQRKSTLITMLASFCCLDVLTAATQLQIPASVPNPSRICCDWLLTWFIFTRVLNPARDSLYHHFLKVWWGTGCWLYYYFFFNLVRPLKAFLLSYLRTLMRQMEVRVCVLDHR